MARLTIYSPHVSFTVDGPVGSNAIYELWFRSPCCEEVIEEDDAGYFCVSCDGRLDESLPTSPFWRAPGNTADEMRDALAQWMADDLDPMKAVLVASDVFDFAARAVKKLEAEDRAGLEGLLNDVPAATLMPMPKQAEIEYKPDR